MEILENIIAIVSIIATMVVAIYSIKKASDDNKVKYVFDYMVSTLIEQFQAFNEILNLLFRVANKVYISNLPENEILESAYTRYWRQIGDISKRVELIRSKKELFFPDDITISINKVILSLNEASKLAKAAKPNVEGTHTLLLKKYEEAVFNYNQALTCARQYLGPSKIARLSFEDTLLLVNNTEENGGKED